MLVEMLVLELLLELLYTTQQQEQFKSGLVLDGAVLVRILLKQLVER
jgi:hypothetical protein